jgi:hypothetical protein
MRRGQEADLVGADCVIVQPLINRQDQRPGLVCRVRQQLRDELAVKAKLFAALQVRQPSGFPAPSDVFVIRDPGPVNNQVP